MFETIGNVLLGAAGSLLASGIERSLTETPIGFSKVRVDAKIEEIACTVVEPLSEYLEKEGVEPEIVTQIVESVTDPISSFMSNSSKALDLGLDVDRITRSITEGLTGQTAKQLSREFPTQFNMILRAFVQLAVELPPLFADWETKKFQSQFKQIDSFRDTLAQVYGTLEAISVATQRDGTLFDRVCAHKASVNALELTIHGLRKSPIPRADLEKLFVQPCLTERIAHKSEDEEVVEHTGFDCYGDLLGSLDPGSQLVVRADAGGGKSTYAGWLASRLLTDAESKMGIVIQLRAIKSFSDAPSLLQLVHEFTTSSFADQISSDILLDWCKSGYVAVIFDGLDEVAEANRDQAVSWISGLQDAYPGLLQLITTRELSTNQVDELLLCGWRNFSIDPFDTRRVQEYISRFQEYGPDIQTGAAHVDANTLASQWEADPTISPLTRNPLLLSTLMVVHHMDGELPDDRSELYERYIDGMLGLWEMKKELVPHKVPLTKEQKKRILQIIAINMISNEVDAIGERSAGKWIKAYVEAENIKGSLRGVLEHLRERSGLLIGPGQYSFAHKTIGEFLVAEACLNGIQRDTVGRRFDRKLIEKHSQSDRWNTVIFLWAGLAPISDVQEFVGDMIDQKNHSLAAGILLDRRKSFDATWMKGELKRLLVGVNNEVDYTKKSSSSFYVFPSSFDGFARSQKEGISSSLGQRQYLYEIRSLARNHVDLRDLLSQSYRLGILIGSDFAEEIEAFRDDLWFDYHFATEFSCVDFVNLDEMPARRLAFLHFISQNSCEGGTLKLANELITSPENFEIARASFICRLLEMLAYPSLEASDIRRIIRRLRDNTLAASLLASDAPHNGYTTSGVASFVPNFRNYGTPNERNYRFENLGEAVSDQLKRVTKRLKELDDEAVSELSSTLESIEQIASRYS